jgi:hypothetical protein
MAYRFLGVKLLPGTQKLFLGTFWLLGTTPPFLGTLERFLGMPKIRTNKFLFHMRAATPRRRLQPPTRAAPTLATSISRRAQSSTRDTLPWAGCTFHTLGNKVLHKTRCAKDRGRLKDTFGNRFEVYWYDAGDGVLHEDDWHFKLMRWQLIALYLLIGDGSLSENAVVPLMQLVTQWQGRRRAYLGC